MRDDVERERVHVRGDVSRRVVGQDQHEQLRELVRDDVARGPTRQAENGSDRGVAPREHEPEPNAGAHDGRHKNDRHGDDSRGGSDAEEQQ